MTEVCPARRAQFKGCFWNRAASIALGFAPLPSRCRRARIEQSDTNIYNAWAAYHQACLQYAECKGLDPAVCDPPPP